MSCAARAASYGRRIEDRELRPTFATLAISESRRRGFSFCRVCTSAVCLDCFNPGYIYRTERAWSVYGARANPTLFARSIRRY